MTGFIHAVATADPPRLRSAGEPSGIAERLRSGNIDRLERSTTRAPLSDAAALAVASMLEAHGTADAFGAPSSNENGEISCFVVSRLISLTILRHDEP